MKWIPSWAWRNDGRLRQRLARRLVGLLLIYTTIVLLLLALEDRFVFRPSTLADCWREPCTDCAFQDEYLQTAAGNVIHARWFPCPGGHGAALFCHGQNANLNVCWPAKAIRQWHRETGLSVLLFDYPGYGRSAGVPSEQGCYEAADAAYNRLVDEYRIAPGELLLVGRSLGSAVAVELASRRPHRALILISPFTSVPDVGQTHFPFLPASVLMRNRFDSLGRIGRCTRPVMIVHGSKDTTVPSCLAKQLYEASPEPRRLIIIPGAGHGGGILTNFFPALVQFLDEYAPPPSPPLNAVSDQVGTPHDRAPVPGP